MSDEPRYVDLTPYVREVRLDAEAPEMAFVALTSVNGVLAAMSGRGVRMDDALIENLRVIVDAVSAQRRRENLWATACRGCACSTCASTMIDLALHPEPEGWTFTPQRVQP